MNIRSLSPCRQTQSDVVDSVIISFFANASVAVYHFNRGSERVSILVARQLPIRTQGILVMFLSRNCLSRALDLFRISIALHSQ